MNLEKECDDLDGMLKNTVSQLGEHFDSVQIVCSKKIADNTIRFQASSGNLYACEGSVREWLRSKDIELKKSL